MKKISEQEFEKICLGIRSDGDSIYKHNPIGTREETLLWMLMNSLIFYLSITDSEMPCFNGMPNAETYRNAIGSILTNNKTDGFDHSKYIDRMVN